MASPISNADGAGGWAGRLVNHDDFASRLVIQRNTLVEEMPRNAGNRRTVSKRALLKALDRLGGEW